MVGKSLVEEFWCSCGRGGKKQKVGSFSSVKLECLPRGSPLFARGELPALRLDGLSKVRSALKDGKATCAELEELLLQLLSPSLTGKIYEKILQAASKKAQQIHEEFEDIDRWVARGQGVQDALLENALLGFSAADFAWGAVAAARRRSCPAFLPQPSAFPLDRYPARSSRDGLAGCRWCATASQVFALCITRRNPPRPPSGPVEEMGRR